MKREYDPILCMKCWLEMKSFLDVVAEANIEQSPIAQDVSNLMRKIEIEMGMVGYE